MEFYKNVGRKTSGFDAPLLGAPTNLSTRFQHKKIKAAYQDDQFFISI